MKTLQGGSPTASPSPHSWHQAAIHTVAEMNPIIQAILQKMAAADFSEKDQFAVRLALEEAIVNGIKHGNGNDPSKKVEIAFQVTPRECNIRVEDEGPGFNPDLVPDPLAPENLERPGGRGVFLIRHYMTSVQFNSRGNGVILSKARG